VGHFHSSVDAGLRQRDRPIITQLFKTGIPMQPAPATQTVDEWVEVETSFGANDGKATG
jgi:hypothetical protein